tara:strand:- start:4858 stop:5934 length:1077 start_codon:yes stop_codon:yes gene_type:complete
MKKIYLMGILAIIFLFAISNVSASFLSIIDVDVKVDGDKESGISTSGGNIDVEPGQKVQIKIKVQNAYDSAAADPEITDVEVEEADIEDIDDDDDLEPEDDPDDFDLDDPGDKKTITLEYEIPIRVEEDTFDLTVEIEGINNSGVKQNVSLDFVIEVDKENHLLQFERLSLSQEKVRCGRNTELDVLIFNIGSEEEEDVELSIKNEDLEISFSEIFDIDEGGEDDDSEFGKSYTVAVPKTAQSGIYTLAGEVEYRSGRETERKTTDLEVDCEAIVTPAATTPKPVVTQPVVTTQVVQPTQPIVTQAPVTQTVPATTSGAFKTNTSSGLDSGLTLIIAGYVIGIIVLIGLIAFFVRRRP